MCYIGTKIRASYLNLGGGQDFLGEMLPKQRHEEWLELS